MSLQSPGQEFPPSKACWVQNLVVSPTSGFNFLALAFITSALLLLSGHGSHTTDSWLTQRTLLTMIQHSLYMIRISTIIGESYSSLFEYNIRCCSLAPVEYCNLSYKESSHGVHGRSVCPLSHDAAASTGAPEGEYTVAVPPHYRESGHCQGLGRVALGED